MEVLFWVWRLVYRVVTAKGTIRAGEEEKDVERSQDQDNTDPIEVDDVKVSSVE